MRNPILVTGCPRAGTTWIGKMINLVQGVGYIHEAYNNMITPKLSSEGPSNQFCFVNPENEDLFTNQFSSLLSLEYSFGDQFAKKKSFSNFIKSIQLHLQFRSYRKHQRVPLVKDPFLIFSADWFSSELNMSPVILMRHPAPIYDSFKRLNWSIDFDHIGKNLPDGISRDIFAGSGFEGRNVPPTPKSIAVLWSIIHGQILTYQKEYPNWLYIRYEDIFLNLESYFKQIFNHLDYSLSDDQLAKIYFYTSRGYFPKEKNDYDTRLERQDLLNGWRSRLSEDEISILEQSVDSDVYTAFYSKSNWRDPIKF